MSDIYCGSRDVPKHKKRGSMKECAEKGQISYYGIKKIDPRLFTKVLESKKGKVKHSTMMKNEAKVQ